LGKLALHLFIYGCFNAVVSSSVCGLMVGVNSELEMMWKEAVVAKFGIFPAVRLDGLRGNTKTLSRYTRS
jgi:hypothetical protein